MSDIPHFNSLVTRQVLDGDKVKIDDLLNKAIIICGFNISTSKFKERGGGSCVKVQFYYADDERKERKIFFSGSSVMKEQLEEAKGSLDKEGLPLLFLATVKKVGNYYSFV